MIASPLQYAAKWGIAFYLDHREGVDRHLAQKLREFQSSAIPLSEVNPELWAKLEQARQAMAGKKE